ncbi:DUF4287 domain-containing protein [Leucobacter salsicius]|nr:DUF4287 domain-containing protein [Leucobacter salsicius]
MADEATGPVTGPKSYFPSIEAKYGKSIDEWIAILRPYAGEKHMAQVAGSRISAWATGMRTRSCTCFVPSTMAPETTTLEG